MEILQSDCSLYARMFYDVRTVPSHLQPYVYFKTVFWAVGHAQSPANMLFSPFSEETEEVEAVQ